MKSQADDHPPVSVGRSCLVAESSGVGNYGLDVSSVGEVRAAGNLISLTGDAGVIIGVPLQGDGRGAVIAPCNFFFYWPTSIQLFRSKAFNPPIQKARSRI